MLSSIISIIIPVYNSEEFLKESIDSTLRQTYSDIEIIAINDGSTDNSLDVLRQYGDKIILIDQENRGLADAVNAGIAKMSGKWMKWLSPDDVLYPDAIENLLKEAKRLDKNSILYSNWEIIDAKGTRIRDFYESNYNNLDNFDFNVRLLDSQQINVNTTLIPKSLFDQGCVMRTFNDTAVIDYDFFLRSAMLYETKFHLIEKSLLKYRIHKNQTSHKHILKSLQFLETIKKDVLSKLDEKTQQKYICSLKEYSKNKKPVKKSMELGLKMLKLLPESFSEQMLIFYLNKIRSRR